MHATAKALAACFHYPRGGSLLACLDYVKDYRASAYICILYRAIKRGDRAGDTGKHAHFIGLFVNLLRRPVKLGSILKQQNLIAKNHSLKGIVFGLRDNAFENPDTAEARWSKNVLSKGKIKNSKE